MLDTLLSPFFLTLIAATAIVILPLMDHAVQRMSSNLVEDVVVSTFFLLTTPIIISPFTYFNVNYLTVADKELSKTLIQFLFYALLVFFGRRSFKYFFKNLLVGLSSSWAISSLLLLALLSAFWSETPGHTFRFAYVMVGTSFMAIHVSQQYSWQRFAKLIRWNLIFIIALSLVFIVAVPSVGLTEKGWRGIFSHAIGFGCISALNLSLWLFDYNDASVKSWLRFLIVGLSLLTTLFSNSATALFILFACVGLFIWFELTRFNLRTKLAILIFSAAVFIALYVLATENLADILALFGRDPSLTGRTIFWDQLIGKVLERPILGYGIDGFWQPWRGDLNPAFGVRLPYFVPTHSHNGYIETALYLGILGLMLLLITHISNFLKIFHGFLGRSKTKTTFLACVLFAFLILFNTGSPGFLEAKHVWFLYLYLTVKLDSPDLNSNRYLAQC